MWSWRHTIHARVRRHRWQMRRSECPLCWLSAAGRPARHVYGLCIAKSELSYKSLGVAAHDVELHGSAQCEARTVGVRSSSFLTARAGPESPTFNPLGAPASKSCKRQNKAGTHGHLRHHVAEDFKGLMHCPVHIGNEEKPPCKTGGRDTCARWRTRRFFPASICSSISSGHSFQDSPEEQCRMRRQHD